MIDQASTQKKQIIQSGAESSALPLWHQRAKNLQWIKLIFSAEARTSFAIVQQKGGLLHDAFGRVLEQVDSTAFKDLWRPTFDSHLHTQFAAGSPPKAFTLNPPRDTKGQYQQGDIFNIDLVLFGHTANHAKACVGTLFKIGQQGLGSPHAKFKLLACDAIKHLNSKASGHSHKSGRFDLQINFLSPAYLKRNGRCIYSAPEFTYLLARIIYRANWLSVCSGRGMVISDSQRKQLLSQAADARLIQDNTHKCSWRRYSVSRKKWMRFDGLTGQIRYSGVTAELIPLLEIAAAINIGGKTSFGMGQLEWCVA